MTTPSKAKSIKTTKRKDPRKIKLSEQKKKAEAIGDLVRKKAIEKVVKEKKIVDEAIGAGDEDKPTQHSTFEYFVMLREKQVKNITLLARTLDVSRPTVYGYIEKYNKYLRLTAYNRSLDIERETEYQSITYLLQKSVGELKKLKGASYIAAARNVCMIMKQRGDLYGLYADGGINLDSKKLSNVPHDEVSDIEGLVKGIKKILGGADQFIGGEKFDKGSIPSGDGRGGSDIGRGEIGEILEGETS